ncbi:lycopene cyclase [Rhodococcus triatomae]|nr:lycopene cyclase [Rhodococcus triatomae]QNG25931.1 lycopene cyclase [Rhodococcus triatomae]
MADLLVVGLGPAGRALAHRAARSGLRTVAVDPRPARSWTPTYALWADEVPAWLGTRVLRTHVRSPRVWTTRERALTRAYGVLDNAAVQRALALDEVEVISGVAVALTSRTATVRTPGVPDLREVSAHTVVDARGTRIAPGRAEQTAFGMVLPRDVAAPALGDGEAWFMDWRPDHGAPPAAPASFLYAVPISADHVLLEETCLVGRPATGVDELRTRLHRRLRARGVRIPDGAPTERVHFAVEPGNTATPALAFGARAGLTHPGTGYSVAASLDAADTLVSALVSGRSPDKALWPARARAVHRLRGAGLESLLRLRPDRTAEFFDAFFDLPETDQRAFLSGRDDLAGTARAMWALFRGVPAGLRWTLARSAL